MAKYDQVGGCPCGLYRECTLDCKYSNENKKTDGEIFDFGFADISEDDLLTTHQVLQELEIAREQSSEMKRRLDKLHSVILPLLDNLRKTPESEYIRWPNRAEKIDAFKAHIAKIVDGDIK